MKKRRIASSFGSVTAFGPAVAFDGACLKFRRNKRDTEWVCEVKPPRKQVNKFPRHPTKFTKKKRS